jgi:hypothetical protein
MVQAGEGGETLKRLCVLQPPHAFLSNVVGCAADLKGDGFAGFYGDLQEEYAATLVTQPWIDLDSLKSAGSLKGRINIDVSDAKISGITLTFDGIIYERIQRWYYGKPDPSKPPPTPPYPNWTLGADGYWYEPREKKVSGTVKIEFSNFDTAAIEQDLRKRLGLK